MVTGDWMRDERNREILVKRVRVSVMQGRMTVSTDYN